MKASGWDYIVVGAGAAGCALAGRLSEQNDTRVLLLEAGPRDSSPLFRIPGLGFIVSRHPKFNWWFETEASPGLNGRRLRWLQGKVLGGSSSINGMIYTRGHSRQYDLWRQMGCEGWSFADLLPLFKQAEANSRGADEWHGGSGAMATRPANPELPICDAFLDACREAGFPIVDDFNRDAVDGFGYYDVNIGKGRRVSAAAAYLNAPAARRNLTVMTGVNALRVVIDKGVARGVEILKDGERQTVWADREVILSGGGVKSPQLLMLSGVGPAEHLRAMDVPVLVDSPRVGQNLQNHPSYQLQYLCSAPVTAYRYLNPITAIGLGARYLATREGGLGEGFAVAGGFFRTDARLEIPDIQVVMSSALMAKPSTSDFHLRDVMPRRHGFAVTVYQGTPFSRGEIKLRSADPLAAPLIYPNYLSDPRDIDILSRGIARVRDVLRLPPTAKYIASEVQPGPSVTTMTELQANIRQNVSSSYHQSGTCAMGSDPGSVVDPQLRVRGVERLRVADASIMPFMLSCALHAPTIMIGEKAAAMIKAGAPRVAVAA